jgi:integrase/recombinase XerD
LHALAVSLLLNGVDLSHVSILLGHASIRITERHYAPWVNARQNQLERDVRRTWADVVAVPERQSELGA